MAAVTELSALASPEPATSIRGGRTVVVFLLALLLALVTRRTAIVGLAALGLVLVPLERLVPFRRQRILRPGLLTDLTHLLVNGILVTIATVVLVVVAAIPLLPLRSLDLEAALPTAASVTLAVLVALIGSYWGHRLTHRVPLLWRFHAVHHSIEHMDWVAAGRLHPLDSAFTQAVAAVPLVALGYEGVALAGVALLVTVLAIFQHANVRLRFPVLRWVVPTPEWHHWHHATDPEAHDTNFGLPVIDKLFSTAYLPKDRRPTAFGIPDPVPADDYLAHLRYPFGGRSAQADGGEHQAGDGGVARQHAEEQRAHQLSVPSLRLAPQLGDLASELGPQFGDLASNPGPKHSKIGAGGDVTPSYGR